MRLVGAELLKMRRRAATWVLLGILVGLMAFVFVVGGLLAAGLASTFEEIGDVALFPAAYALVGDFVFGLGSLLAIVYATAIVGADYSWGVLRNPISRGESRALYAIAKAVGLAIMLALGAIVAYVCGVVFLLLAAGAAGLPVGDAFSMSTLRDLLKSVGLGLTVLLERAAIGFAVAVVLRSQMAGIVTGIVLYVAEPILGAIAGAITTVNRFTSPFRAADPEWNQFLPFSIGNSVLAEGSATLLTAGPAQFITPVVKIELALPVVLIYLVGAVAFSALVMHRQEIVN
jgi:ABC-2 type transport system permease protein